jgi:putative DNA primase/helicase
MKRAGDHWGQTTVTGSKTSHGHLNMNGLSGQTTSNITPPAGAGHTNGSGYQIIDGPTFADQHRDAPTSAASTLPGTAPADAPPVNGKPVAAAPIAHPQLWQQHLDELRQGSGLSDETIIRCGLTTETDGIYIAKKLGWYRAASALGPVLEIPFYDAAGNKTDYSRFKPSTPRINEDTGKPNKYESPIGSGNRAYFPPLPILAPALAKPESLLLITEGEKKAACACQHGFPCVGISGVWNACKPKQGKAPRELIDDLAGIAWQGRTVCIVYDSDAAQNIKVLAAERSLAKALQKQGAIIRIIRLPDGGKDASGKPIKVGLDDYLVAHGAAALQQLIDAAGTANPTSKPGGAIERKPWEGIADPHYLTRQLLGAYRHADRPKIISHRDQILTWDDGSWQGLSDGEACGIITRFAKRQIDLAFAAMPPPDDGKEVKAPQVTTGMVSNITQALRGEVMLSSLTPFSVWIGPGEQRRNYLSMANGLLDIDAALRGETECLLAHSPNWFSPVRLDYTFDRAAKCPTLLAFLNHNLEGVQSAKAQMLQRFAGYLLHSNISLQRFLLMLGEGSNGKSVVCAILEAMLGETNCSSVALEAFGDKFALKTTLGKLANITAEVGELDRVAEGQLKAFVSGDLMQFEQKFKSPFSARPTARLVLSTNNMPEFRDKTDGLWRRPLLLKFTVQIPPDQRIRDMDTPGFWAAERPGILNWALAGLHALLADGRFNEPADMQTDLDKLRGEANPARRFLTENCKEGTGEVEKALVYARYQDWCKRNGHHPMSSNKLASEIYRRFKQVREGKPMHGGHRVRTFQGLELLPDL